jgi:DNA-binding transcriptional LysR family regulator
MEFKALRIFVEVVRNNGFSRAAAVSSVTQSTVSKIIKQLEHELGAPIIDRIGRRATPTDLGSVVYRHALKILADRDNMIVELGDIRSLKRLTQNDAAMKNCVSSILLSADCGRVAPVDGDDCK